MEHVPGRGVAHGRALTGLKRWTFRDAVIAAIALALCAVFILPFLSVLARSLSDESAVLAGQVRFVPVGFQLGAYRFALSTRRFFVAFGNSVLVTAAGTAVALLGNTLLAFPLAHKDLRGAKIIRRLVLFTMIFSAGIVPGYLVVRGLGLLNKYGALILPAAISPYYLLIIISFMRAIPPSLEESARIDGASDFVVYARIVMPLSKPVLASIGLFFAVDYWNDFFRPLMFIQSQNMYPLSLYLRQILIDSQEITKTLDTAVFGSVAPSSVQNATILIATVPILLVYPFVQRFFVTGISVGAIKE